jgi:isopenicillin N synthase-like dioxygenase
MDVKTVQFGKAGAATEFTESLLETGFAVLEKHPIPVSLIFETYAEWVTFFNSGKKAEYTYSEDTQTGYFPLRAEKARDASVSDLKEFFHYYPTRGSLPDCARTATPELYRRLTDLGSELLDWIESCTPARVREHFPLRLSEMIRNSEATLLRILHYPPLKGDEGTAVRAAAHEDINLITLLPAATEPGLEVKDMQGQWHAVSCDPGAIVVNSGDMLKVASEGYYPSTTHRVANPVGVDAQRSRYSIPFFLHPRSDALLTKERTAHSFLQERLQELGLLKRKSGSADKQ